MFVSKYENKTEKKSNLLTNPYVFLPIIAKYL